MFSDERSPRVPTRSQAAKEEQMRTTPCGRLVFCQSAEKTKTPVAREPGHEVGRRPRAPSREAEGRSGPKGACPTVRRQ